jgi:hypothetical protein
VRQCEYTTYLGSALRSPEIGSARVELCAVEGLLEAVGDVDGCACSCQPCQHPFSSYNYIPTTKAEESIVVPLICQRNEIVRSTYM